MCEAHNTFSAQIRDMLLLDMHSLHNLIISLGQCGANSQEQRVPHNKPDAFIQVGKEICSRGKQEGILRRLRGNLLNC